MSNRGYTDAEIARVAYAAHRELMRVNGDPHAGPRWEDLPGWWQESAVADLSADRHRTAEDLHTEWRRRKLATGWVWGPVRDEEAKTHPCLVVDYRDVPARERMKDVLYLAVIAAFDGAGR